MEVLQLHSGLRRGLQHDLGVLEACGGTCWQFSGFIVFLSMHRGRVSAAQRIHFGLLVMQQ